MKTENRNLEGLGRTETDLAPADFSGEEILKAHKISFQDLRDHMTGPVISIVAHIILLSFLASMIITQTPPERTDIEVEYRELELVKLKDLPELPPPPVLEPVERMVEPEHPQVDSNIDVPLEQIVFESTDDVQVPNFLQVKPTISALVTSALVAIRTGKAKRDAINRYGPDVSGTEIAAVKGLRWLRDHQNDDGSWGEESSRQPAFTGLALLAFLGYGETPSSAEFGPCVLKSIKKLIEYSEAPNPVQACAGNGYGHPIVTYAISEAYALTKIPMLEKVSNSMAAYVVKGQNAVGAYNYFYDNSKGRCDLSVMGWCYQALKAAVSAESTVPDLETAIAKGVQCLKSQQRDLRTGGFVYQTDIGAPGGSATNNVTAVGTLCLQLFGEGKSQEALGGMKYLKEKCFSVTWDGRELENKGGSSWALYRWYYQTQAFFQGNEGKGPDWKAWNRIFATALMENQKNDGHWESPASSITIAKGSAETHGEGMFKGLDQGIYSTALCCLMLEVYYRYLPTFKVVEAKFELPAMPASGLERKKEGGLVIE